MNVMRWCVHARGRLFRMPQPPGTRFYRASDVKVPRAAACLDVVRSTVYFDDPVKMVDAFEDIQKSLVRARVACIACVRALRALRACLRACLRAHTVRSPVPDLKVHGVRQVARHPAADSHSHLPPLPAV